MDDNLDTLAQTLNEIITTTRSKRRNTIFPHALEELKQQKAELIKLKNSGSIKNGNADLEALKSHPSLLTKIVPITGGPKSKNKSNLNGESQNTDSRSKSDHYVNRGSDNNRNRTKTSTMVGKSVRSSPNRKGVVKSKTPEPNNSKWVVNERNRKLNTRPKSADRNPRSANIVRGSKQRARSFELSPKTKVPNKDVRGRSPLKKGSRTHNKADCMQQCSSREIIVISRPQTPCSDRDSRIAINLRNISSNSQVRLSLDTNRCQNRATATLEEGECQCLIDDLKDEIEAYRENAKTDCCQFFTPIRVEISSKKESHQKVVTEPRAACDYLDRLKEEIFKYRKLATDHEIELAEIRKEIQDYRKNCLCALPACELPKVPEESTTSSLSHTDGNVTPEIPSDEAGSSTDKMSIRSEKSSCVCADDKKAKIEPECDHYIMTEENVTPEISSEEAGSSLDKMSIRSKNSSCICAGDMKGKNETECDHYITEESIQSKKEEDKLSIGPSDQEVLEDVEKTSNDETSEEQHEDEDIPIGQVEENCDCKEIGDQDGKEAVNGDDKERSEETEEEEDDNAIRVKTSEVKSEGIESRIEDCGCDGHKNEVHLQKQEEESPPQAKADVDPELCISFRSQQEFTEEEEEDPQIMIWTSDVTTAAAIQSSSEEGLQENVVEKQIEEANKLIERVMSALKEIKLGITQYKTSPNVLSADKPNMPCPPGCSLKEISAPCMKKYRQSKSPTSPTKRCRSPAKYQARPQKCSPFIYDRPVPKTEVSNQHCSVCNKCSRPHTPKTSCNRYTCAQLGAVSVSMPKKQLKGEKPLVDEETDPTLRPFPVDNERPKTRRGGCRAPCTIQVQTQSYDPVEQEPPVVTDEPSHSMEALKAKLSTISEPSDTSSEHLSKKTDVKEDAKDAPCKLLPLKKPNSSRETNTADKLVQRCVKCLKSGTPTRDCICAKILGVLSVSHQAPVSNVKQTVCHGGKKDRLQVQNIPPVSIKSGLVVQKVLDLAIKPTGSTDAVVDKTDNIKYEEVVEETGDPEALGKKLSFMSEEEKQKFVEDIKLASGHSYSLPSPQSSSSTKLSVLQSYQVLPNDNMIQLDTDTPDLSTISGNVNIDVYKTYIDPYAEIMSTTDDDEERERQEVKLSRIRRSSMRPKTSSGAIKARLSQEDPSRSKEKRPIDPEDTSVVEKEISVQKLTEQEREQPLVSLVEAEKDSSVTAPAAFGLKSPFEIGLYENKSIQCGSSYIPTLKTETKMKVTLSSSIGSNSSRSSPVPRYRSASIQADGSLEEDSSSGTVSNGSEDSTAETLNKALQVSFSSSSESSSSGTDIVSEQVSFNKNKNMKYNVSYMEDVKRNETVDNFLTGLTEQSAKSIDMFQKSHGNLEDKPSNVVGSVPSGYEHSGSISTLDLDENAAMLKNLVHDPNKRKKPSSKPVTPTLSSNIPSVNSKSGKNPSVHCCQLEYNDIDMWKPVRLSDYNITRDTKENVETSTDRQMCSGSEKNIQRMSKHESSFRNSPLEHSASDPETLPSGEYKCKCSVSSGEIHVCPFGRDMRNRVKYLKRHPERFLRKELGDSKLKILAQRRFYNHWVSYYIQLDSSRNNTSISTNSDENHTT